MSTSWYVNVNYVCNERCTFCAAELADGSLRIDGRLATVTLADVEGWLGPERPGPDDRVAIAGGEPTLHRELLPIASLLGRDCPHVVLFTNGLRLADPDYAASTAGAGITDYEIAFYGADASTHEAVTRRRDSFEQTLAAVEVLARLRVSHGVRVNARLLVSRQSAPENPGIVHLLHERLDALGLRIDSFSLQRLILSEDAKAADAEISWADAAPAINDSAALARDLGYEVRLDGIPLCVYEGANAEHVRQQLLAPDRAAEPVTRRYLDPYVAAGRPEMAPPRRRAMPDVCVACAYRNVCGRVERWYLKAFGTAGLRTVIEPIPTPVTIGAR
jgi:MoaA/NifB/PqqE/SkfB family radical SAM enzyme